MLQSTSRPENWSRTYARSKRSAHATFPPDEARVIRILERTVPLGPGTRVIELGGGGGTRLLPYAYRGCECYAFDYSREGLRQTQALFSAHGFRVTTVEADLFKSDISKHGTFDVVASYGLCEHFTGTEREEIFRIHSRLVRPGGCVLIYVPHRMSPTYRIWYGVAAYLARKGLADRLDINIIDEVAFRRTELVELAERAGLSTQAIMGTSIVRDAVELLGRPAIKVARRLAHREYVRPPSAPSLRTPLDDLLGAYLYWLGTKY